MSRTQRKTIFKLRNAINAMGSRLLFTTSEFYSEDMDRPVAIYHIKNSVYNVDTDRYDSKELFSSPSQIQVVLFLRDYLFTLQGKELPTDNPVWNEIRPRFIDKLPINVNKEGDIL